VALLSGSDDDLLCEVSFVPISAVLVAAEQIGYRAAQVLDWLMRGRPAPKQPALIPPLGIVTRQSTDTLAIRDRALVAAVSFIRENAAKPVQVNDVAQHAGVSRRVLERRFMQVLERTVAEEIRRVHFELAKKLLVETDLAIPEVADAAGFGTPEYFAYVFKRELGQTPLKYRKQIRGW
jgi:LacI family transcriptional regulator